MGIARRVGEGPPPQRPRLEALRLSTVHLLCTGSIAGRLTGEMPLPWGGEGNGEVNGFPFLEGVGGGG